MGVRNLLNGVHKVRLVVEQADKDILHFLILPDTLILSAASLISGALNSPIVWSFGEVSKDFKRIRDIRIPHPSGEGHSILPEILHIHGLSLNPEDKSHPVQLHFTVNHSNN